jgi:hypothetical protein
MRWIITSLWMVIMIQIYHNLYKIGEKLLGDILNHDQYEVSIPSETEGCALVNGNDDRNVIHVDLCDNFRSFACQKTSLIRNAYFRYIIHDEMDLIQFL